MTTKRDVSPHKGDSASARRNQLGERRGEDGPEAVKGSERREKVSRERDGDPDAGIHDA